MRKNNIFFIVCLVLLVVLALGFNVYADEPTQTIDISATDGASTVTMYYYEDTHTIVISGTGATKDFTNNTAPIQAELPSVTSVVVEEGVTYLGNYLFARTQNTAKYLSNANVTISLPSTLTGIGNYTFSNAKFVEITLPANLEAVGNAAFYNCSALETVNFNNGLLTLGSSAFYGSGITSVDLPASVTSIGQSCFSNCEKLVSVSINGPTVIGKQAFQANYYVATSTLKSLLTTVYIDADAIIGEGAFNYCSKINSFTYLGEMLSYNICYQGNMFNIYSNTSGRTATIHANNVYLKEGLEEAGFIVTTVGSYTLSDKFESYPSQFIYDISKNQDGSVLAYFNIWSGEIIIKGVGETKDYSTASSNKTPLYSSKYANNGGSLGIVKNIIVEEGVTSLGNYLFCAGTSYTYQKLGHSGVSITLPSTLERIGDYTFYGAYLYRINLPNGLTEIGNYAFYNNTYLISIVIPSTVTSIGDSNFRTPNTPSYAWKTIYNLAEESQTVGTTLLYTNYTNAYLYSTNTGFETAITSRAKSITYLDDEVPTSGDINDIHWEYNASNHSLIFTGEGELPNYNHGSQPWYAVALLGGGIKDYYISREITLNTNGTDFDVLRTKKTDSFYSNSGATNVIDYYGGSDNWGKDYDYSGVTVYCDSSLYTPILRSAPYVTVSPLSTIVKVYVDDVEVNFPDVEPKIVDNEIYAPLRFILQDLGATVRWSETEKKVIIQYVDDGNLKEIVLKPGSNKMEVNGKAYSSSEIGLGATVVIENGRCLLPGRAIVKAYDSVRFKASHTIPSDYYDYYYLTSTPVDGEDSKLSDIPSLDAFEYDDSNSVLITDENEDVIEASIVSIFTSYIVNEAGGNGETVIIVDAYTTIFKAVVPIKVNINQAEDGTVSVLGSYSIDNMCPSGPILIADCMLVMRTGWNIADYYADYKNMPASSLVLGLAMNGADFGTDGTITLNSSLSSSIYHNESKDLVFSAKLSAQKSPISNLNIAAIVFTLDFDKV